MPQSTFRRLYQEIGRGYSIKEAARVISKYWDLLAKRTFNHSDLISKAHKGVIVLHRLQDYRDKEIANEVMECESSGIFEQTENRMYSQQALLFCLLTWGLADLLYNRYKCIRVHLFYENFFRG